MRTFLMRAGLAAFLLMALSLPILAGAAGGPARRTATVQGFQTKTLRMTFEPGRPVVLRLKGDGDTPLGLMILDAQGHQIARVGSSPDARTTARWTPKSAGPYVIKIVNRGGVPTRFVVRTN